MSNKPKDTHYTEMRNVVCGTIGGKAHLKRELVPGMLAWFLMLGKRYAKAEQAVRERMIKETVPGAEQYAVRMGWACDHMLMLAKSLSKGFTRRDYADAAAEVAEAMGLTPGLVPGWDIEDETVDTIMGGSRDAGTEGEQGGSLRHCVAQGPGWDEPSGGEVAGRSERPGGGGVAGTEEHAGSDVPDGARGGGPSHQSNRKRGSDAKRSRKPKRGTKR